MNQKTPRTLLLMLALSVTTAASMASPKSGKGNTGQAVRVTGPTIVGFAPANLLRNAKKGDPGAGAAVEHLEMGLTEAKRCLEARMRTVTLETVYGSVLVLEHDGTTTRITIPRDRATDMGAYFLAPGRKPCVVNPQGQQPSSLGLILPSAAGEYFGVATCVDKMAHGFCKGDG